MDLRQRRSQQLSGNYESLCEMELFKYFYFAQSFASACQHLYKEGERICVWDYLLKL